MQGIDYLIILLLGSLAAILALTLAFQSLDQPSATKPRDSVDWFKRITDLATLAVITVGLFFAWDQAKKLTESISIKLQHSLGYASKTLPDSLIEVEAWDRYFVGTFRSSPILCRLYKEHSDFMAKSLTASLPRGVRSNDGYCPYQRFDMIRARIIVQNALAGLIVCFASAVLAEEKPALKLTTPATTVRLFGAHCLINCSLSGLFAPSVVRDNVAPVPVINTSKEPIKLTAKFVPTNGLAMGQSTSYLRLSSAAGQDMLTPQNPPGIQLGSGDTAQLKLELTSNGLPAGLYTGQVQFRAEAAMGTADPITQLTTIELRIRSSAFWALVTVVLGIVLGRLTQLVYDPKLIARVQLLDWLNELEAKINLLPEPSRTEHGKKLSGLKAELFSRGVDPAALQAKFQAFEGEVNAAVSTETGRPMPTFLPQGVSEKHGRRSWSVAGGIGYGLRILAGVTPLSIPRVHDWILPVFVLATLIILTVVFMLQQYGGSGTAETFGAGGLADYAALFLAGIATEAVAGGLRAIKFTRQAG